MVNSVTGKGRISPCEWSLREHSCVHVTLAYLVTPVYNLYMFDSPLSPWVSGHLMCRLTLATLSKLQSKSTSYTRAQRHHGAEHSWQCMHTSHAQGRDTLLFA